MECQQTVHCTHLTRFNKIALKVTPQMAVANEAIELIESILIKKL